VKEAAGAQGKKEAQVAAAVVCLCHDGSCCDAAAAAKHRTVVCAGDAY
jgi:hypothetical protein